MKSKRATKDEPIFLDANLFKDLENLAEKIEWPYTSDLKEALTARDRALWAFLILSGCRASEAIQLKRKQFRVYPNRIEAANITTLKNGLVRSKIIMPKTGNFKNLTLYFQAWLDLVPDESDAYIFGRGLANGKLNFKHHISRQTVYFRIALNGKFPHWARAVCETVYARRVFKNDAYKLKEFMGLKRLESTAPYVQGSWQENENNIYKI